MQVTASTLSALGFEEIKSALTAQCRTEIGRQRAAARPFLDSRDEVLTAYALVDEAQKLREEPMSLPIGGLTDIRVALDRAGKGGMLEPRESHRHLPGPVRLRARP